MSAFIGASCTLAQACGPRVSVQFIEDSPDKFQIRIRQGPNLSLSEFTIDLKGSAAGALFDNYDGLTMQGPQPNANGVSIQSVTYRTKGPDTAVVTFQNFMPKRAATFRSDLDDRGLAADIDENHLYDGELEGATATALLIPNNAKTPAESKRAPIEITGRFDKKGQAILGPRACV